jgi:hypothetical protein
MWGPRPVVERGPKDRDTEQAPVGRTDSKTLQDLVFATVFSTSVAPGVYDSQPLTTSDDVIGAAVETSHHGGDEPESESNTLQDLVFATVFCTPVAHGLYDVDGVMASEPVLGGDISHVLGEDILHVGVDEAESDVVGISSKSLHDMVFATVFSIPVAQGLDDFDFLSSPSEDNLGEDVNVCQWLSSSEDEGEEEYEEAVEHACRTMEDLKFATTFCSRVSEGDHSVESSHQEETTMVNDSSNICAHNPTSGEEGEKLVGNVSKTIQDLVLATMLSSKGDKGDNPAVIKGDNNLSTSDQSVVESDSSQVGCCL